MADWRGPAGGGLGERRMQAVRAGASSRTQIIAAIRRLSANRRSRASRSMRTRRRCFGCEVLMDRRSFLTTTGAALVAATVPDARAQQPPREKARFRTGLVAYSYRQALQAKTMTYEDLIRIAIETGTDGVDMTVYWLPATTDDYLLPLRRFAYTNRVEIYSIGTRVRLAQPTDELRQQQLNELRRWLDVAQKVGATPVRVFGGAKPDGAHLAP